MEETTESPFIRIRTRARRPFTKLTKGERKKKKTEPFQSLSPARVNFVFCHIQLFFFFFSLFYKAAHTYIPAGQMVRGVHRSKRNATREEGRNQRCFFTTSVYVIAALLLSCSSVGSTASLLVKQQCVCVCVCVIAFLASEAPPKNSVV